MCLSEFTSSTASTCCLLLRVAYFVCLCFSLPFCFRWPTDGRHRSRGGFRQRSIRLGGGIWDYFLRRPHMYLSSCAFFVCLRFSLFCFRWHSGGPTSVVDIGLEESVGIGACAWMVVYGSLPAPPLCTLPRFLLRFLLRFRSCVFFPPLLFQVAHWRTDTGGSQPGGGFWQRSIRLGYGIGVPKYSLGD